MSQQFTFTAEERQEGIKANALRRNHQIPATVYGAGIKNVQLAMSADMFAKLYKEAGITHIIRLNVGSTTYPVLVRSAQKHPVTGVIQHVEFHAINLTETLQTQVPIEIEGDSPAVAQGIGTVLQLLQTLEVECLPTAIPDHIAVNVSGLAEINDELRVESITPPAGVKILTDAELPVVKIASVVVEAEPQPVATETPEGETPAEPSGEETPTTEEAPAE